MKILFLSRWHPYPPNNGSKLRIYNLINGLAKSHEVTLLSFIDHPKAAINNLESCSSCNKVKLVPWKNFTPTSITAGLGFLSLRPRSLIDTYSPEMERHVRESLAGEDYDMIIASQITAASYSRYFNGVPALFEEVELSVLYERFWQAKSALRRFRSALTWAKHRRYLARLLRDFRACTVVSAREQQLLSSVAPHIAPIEVIPNFIDLADYAQVREVPQPNSLIFTGSFRYSANHDAMAWFFRHVYPLIQAQVPDVTITITGDHANLPLPSATNMTLTGFVDNVRPLVASAWVSLAPIRVGGGTRLKILESMALGTPVVATSKGAEGLEVHHRQHLLIADTPQEFAESVVRLLREPELRRGIADRAHQLVRERYDQAVVMPRFLSLVQRVARV
jgi:glycosyltransferase involved in cell wall biosynthesis